MILLKEIFSDSTVIGVLIGSSISIVGLFLSGYIQNRLTRKQQVSSIKFEIFRKAMTGLSTNKTVVTNLPNIPIDNLESMMDSLWKAEFVLVASKKTYNSVHKYHVRISELILELLPRRQELENMKLNIEVLQSLFDQAISSSKKILDDKKKISQDQQELIRENENALMSYQNEIDNLDKELTEKRAIFSQRLLEVSSLCVEHSSSLLDLEIRAISSIRKELGLGFNDKDFREVVQVSQSNVMADYDEFSKILLKQSKENPFLKNKS